MFKKQIYFIFTFLLSLSLSFCTNVRGEDDFLCKKIATPSDSLIGDNFPVCIEQNDQQNPAIAYNTNDNEYLVVWHDSRNDTSTNIDIYGQRVSIAGELLGNNFPICTAINNQTYPVIAYNNKDNEYLVVWRDNRNYDNNHPHDKHVYGQRIANDGMLIGDSFPISTMPTDLVRNPSVAYCDSLNEYLVVWEVDIDIAGPPYGWVFKIRGQRVSNTGELLDNSGTPEDESDPMINFSISVEEDIEHQGCSPDIVYNFREAQYIVVWRDGRLKPGSGNDDIFGQIILCTGKHVLPYDIPICIQHDRNGKAGQNQNGPAVAYNDRDNEYLVIWHDERNDTNRNVAPKVYNIYGQLLTKDGQLIDNPKTPIDESDPNINYPICTTQGMQWWPDVAFNSNSGGYLVIWTDGRNDPGDKSNFDIYGLCVSNNIECLGNNFVISEAENNQGTWQQSWLVEEYGGICLAYSNNDHQYLIIWADQRNEDISGNDIYGQRIEYIPGVISGYINYYSDSLNMVNNALVSLSGTLTKEDTTSVDGYYDFSNLTWGNYSTKPGKEHDLANAISAYDASLILQYVVGLIKLSPYQMIAADVSGNGEVTTYDASFILRYVVGLIDSFPVMPDTSHFWTLVPTSFPIDSTNWSTAPDSLRYEPLISDTLNQNFVGIIYGDVSGNWSPAEAQIASKRITSKTVNIYLGDVSSINGNIFSIPIKLEKGNDLLSARFTIEYDPEISKVLDVNLNELTSNFSLAYKINKEQVKVALAGSEPLKDGGAIVKIRYKILNNSVETKSPLKLTEAIVNEGRVITNVQQANNNLLPSIPTEFGLSQNYPNPFNAETIIQYQLPKTCKVRLRILNLLGQEVRTLIDETMEAGYHKVNWNGKNNNRVSVASGIYLYCIEAEKFRQVRKLIIIR